MIYFSVKGMTCAACSARIEKAVMKVKGVNSCSVNLLTNSMGVEGTASADEIINAVRKAGYDAALKTSRADTGSKLKSDEDFLKDRETPSMIRRLLSSLFFLIILMYISMGHMMWNFPLPSFLAENHAAMGLAQMLLL